MQVRSSPFVNVRTGQVSRNLVLVMGSCSLLSACIGNPFARAQVDPRSPIAAEVAKSVRPHASYPTFKDIPPVPKDLRPHKEYGEQADVIEKEAAVLTAATREQTWTLSDTGAFVAQGLADAGPAIAPADPAETAAFEKDSKARATAPPPPKR